MKVNLNENIHRGDVYYADLSPVTGSEQGGIRPVLVVQNDVGNKFSPTIIIAPITSHMKKRNQPTHVSLPATDGLSEDSMILLEQVRTIDRSRLDRRVSRISNHLMHEVDSALATSLGLSLAIPEESPNEMVLCLCPTCAAQFYNSPDHTIRRVDPYSAVKDECTYCQVRMGYDYRITYAKKKLGSDR